MPRRRVIWDHVHLFIEMPPAGGSAGATRLRQHHPTSAAPPDFGSTIRLRQHHPTSAAPPDFGSIGRPTRCARTRSLLCLAQGRAASPGILRLVGVAPRCATARAWPAGGPALGRCHGAPRHRACRCRRPIGRWPGS